MNKLMVIIFFSWISLSWAANHYVDKNATSGGNSGVDWNNAWTSFAAINWSLIEPGDVIYISGGPDSTIYYEQLYIGNVQGTAANPITIIAGKYAPNPTGHSGRVIIDGEDTREQCIYLGHDSGVPYSTDYITIKGLELRGGASGGIELEGRTNVTIIDSMTITNFGDLAGVFARGMGQQVTCDGIDSLMIRNNWIRSYSYHNGQTDGIFLDACTNTFIYNNYIHIPNQDEYAHVDCIQQQWSQGLVIYNNVLINDSVNSPEGGGMPIIVRSSDLGDHNPIIIYNNFCYMGGAWMPGANNGIVLNLHSGDQSLYPPSPSYIFHNTIVGNGPQLNGVSLDYFGQGNDGKGIFHNNIVAQYGSGAGGISWLITFGAGGAVSPIHVDSVKNNLFYKEWGTVNFAGSFTNGVTTASGFDWTYWTGTLGGSGLQTDPLLVNNIGNEPDQSALRGYLQENSPAINAGEDVSYLFDYLESTYGIVLPRTDIDGNSRNLSNPTIGAYQYVPRGPDITPPEVTGATLLDSVTLKIMFSEMLDETTAEDENNYSISTNINVFNASLSGSEVTLQTSTHSPGLYIVTVVNVEDLAGNPIAQSNTAEYSLIPPDSLIFLPIENVQGVIQEPLHTPLKTIDGLGALSGDPDSRWAAEPMPEELVFDLGIIRTVRKTKLSFYNWNAGRVYNYSISISSDNNNWVTIVSQVTSASNEEWTIDEFPAVDARYVKIHFINNNQSDWAGLWEGEIWGTTSTVGDPINNGLLNEFSLQQNYPNPFNPSTTISYFIPASSFVTLKVYDVLGNEVATLVNANKPKGSYEVTFSTTGGSSSGGGDVYNLPSGIYFYRLQAGSFVETKKMILLK